MTIEPARLVALLTAAVGATVNVLALIFDWSGELVAGLNIALAAWIALAGEFVRSQVTPNDRVAVTTDGKSVNPIVPEVPA